MNILIVDDEEMQRTMLRQFLEKQGYRVFTAADGGEALGVFMEYPVELVLLDHRMPDMNGDELLARLKEINPATRAVMITAYGAVDTAVRVMRLGADHFFEKPIDLQELLAVVTRIEEEVVVAGEAEEVAETIDRQKLPVRLIGESPSMQQVLSVVHRVAPAPWTVLIAGETGTGKELIARLIHLLSPRKAEPFIELNCAAIPENLFESELFGHEKGAFTGAAARRRGVFELAHGGTLFLDEVAELPLTVQAKLLRALQEKTVIRVGGEKGIPVDVRIIAATNRDLRTMVSEGAFREDLYFRLNVIEVELPPLRRRKEDIPLLVDFFLKRYGHSRVSFDSRAMGRLLKYNYPGNIRELEHIIQRTITLARRRIIVEGDLPEEIRGYRGRSGEGGLSEQLAEFERKLLLEALEKHGWVQTRAAESLGISERVLRYKMEKAGIRKPR